jgi:hypothetical protein
MENQTLMDIIRDGLKRKHSPGEGNTDFVDAIYSLFKEYCEDYKSEWERLDENEEIYHGNHWASMPTTPGDSNPNLPKPSTPIITSTIENIKADLSDEMPEAVILPDSVGNEALAKALTKIIGQELDVCDFELEYAKMTQDMLNGGWTVMEVGYDQDLNNGLGGAYLRYVINKNWMCDPQCIDLQEGRAVFKVDRRPYDWFKQHYPDHYQYMSGDSDLLEDTHDDFGAETAAQTKQSYRLIEAWFRVYDHKEKTFSIHFVKVAGHQVLESSFDAKPDGYYAHGFYPFIVVPLFPQKGSALGLGITDLFKDVQRYSDKLDQILLTNAFRASHNRMIIQKDSVDFDDARDFAKEIIQTTQNPSAAVHWMETKPLPSYLMNYIQIIRNTIKGESGSNEQSRGNTGSSVTAASAITALQDMSTKRSRMEARALQYGFKKAVRMMIDVLREFSLVPRDVVITVQGQPQVLSIGKKDFKKLFPGNMPVEHYIDIKTARQTKYTKMMHNELWLQMLKTLQGMVDPAIMIEGLEYDEKEQLLDNIRKAQSSGMLALQQQVAQLTEMLNQQGQELEAYKGAIGQAQAALANNQEEEPAGMYGQPMG